MHRYIECAYAIDGNDERSVHEWIKAQMEVAKDPTTEQMATALHDKAREHLTKMLATEARVWHDELQIAGTADAVGIWRGRPTLIDWKTANRRKAYAYTHDYRVQVTAYALCMNALFDLGIEDYAIVITIPNDEPQLLEGKIADHEAELRDRVQEWRELQWLKQAA